MLRAVDVNPSLTVIIPTHNEEAHIARAIRSVGPLGPVWVVDCGSTDRTVAFAEACGARTVYQQWLGHASQKNWALDNLEITTEWVLFLDADEVASISLVDEILRVTDRNLPANGYLIPRRNRFMGRDLEHVWWYPDYQLRLFRHGKARYEQRNVHEHMVVEGEIGRLEAALEHENLKGVQAFLDRHVRYAEAEAEAVLAAQTRGTGDRGSWLVAGPRGRRRAVKVRLWYRMKHRPAIRFLWLYILRRGYSDGEQGRVYAQLISAYEAMVDAFLLEKRQAVVDADRPPR